MRARVAVVLLLAAACTRAAVDDPAAAPEKSDAGASEPATTDAGVIVEASAAVDAAAPKTCAALPAYVCDFSIGSCNPFDGVGLLNVPGGSSDQSFVDDGGPDGSRAVRAFGANGGGGLYRASFQFDFDGGAKGCNFVCDVDLRVEATDPGAGVTVLFGVPDFATTPARLRLTDTGWVHTGGDPTVAQNAPLAGEWFHARLAMTRLPMDGGSTSTLTLSFGDASTTTNQRATEMPIGLAVGVISSPDASATAFADNVVCHAVD